jgi:hypothetical protein
MPKIKSLLNAISAFTLPALQAATAISAGDKKFILIFTLP